MVGYWKRNGTEKDRSVGEHKSHIAYVHHHPDQKRNMRSSGRREEGCGDCGWEFTLLGDIEPFGSVGILIFASEKLPQYRIISDERQGRDIVRVLRRWVQKRTHGFLTPLGFMCHPAK